MITVIAPFKVIQGHQFWYQSKAQIIGQIGAFEAPFGGLGATYDVHLRLIGKLIGDFLLVIIELFLLGAFVLSQFTP